MVVMTAKLDKKKIGLVLAGLALVIVLLIALFGGGKNSADPVETNADRVALLNAYGWQVEETPVKTQKVIIPTDTSDVFAKYNELQKNQGFDLTAYAGKEATRYVYTVTNFPDAKGTVYATLLVYNGQVIGGDVTDTGDSGVIQGLKKTN